MTAMPSLFISHGAPTLIMEEVPARDFLGRLGGDLPRPAAILVVSAHWESDAPLASISAAPATIHDFHGFPAPLYRLRYAAPGAPDLAREVVERLTASGLDARADGERGLDHGAWVPLKLMYPDAGIPVAQLSIQPRRGPDHHWALGEALRPLRDKGVLVLGSGAAVHNLRELSWGHHEPVPAWARAFDDWLAASVEAGDRVALCGYAAIAPQARRAHPRDEHYLPLLVAAGAAGGETGRRVHASFTHGCLSMAAFAFGVWETIQTRESSRDGDVTNK